MAEEPANAPFFPGGRLLLLFSDKEAAAPFRSLRSWSAAAIREAGIEVIVVDLPEHERVKIRDAQRRQYR